VGQVALDLLQTVQSDRWSLKPDTRPKSLQKNRLNRRVSPASVSWWG
jgi:hypothetical protein